MTTTAQTVSRYALTTQPDDPRGPYRVVDTESTEVLASTPYAHIATIVIDALEAVPA